MRLLLTVKFKDDKSEDYECVDFPSVGDWITLYLSNFERKIFTSAGVAEINYKIVSK